LPPKLQLQYNLLRENGVFL